MIDAAGSEKAQGATLGKLYSRLTGWRGKVEHQCERYVNERGECAKSHSNRECMRAGVESKPKKQRDKGGTGEMGEYGRSTQDEQHNWKSA